MEICNSCNKEKQTKKYILNGTITNLCEECSKGENVIEVKPDKVEEKISKLEKEEYNEMIIPNYYDLIKNVRERKGISTGNLAREIGESVREMQDIEEGRKKPTFVQAKKIGKYLGISLIDKYRKLFSDKQKIDFRNPNIRIKDLKEKTKDLK